MSLFFAAMELCLLLQQSQQEIASAAERTSVILRLNQLGEITQPLIMHLIAESHMRQVRDDVEKEVISGLEDLFEQMIEEEFAGKERREIPPLDTVSTAEVWILPNGQARYRWVIDYFSEDAQLFYDEALKDFQDAIAPEKNETQVENLDLNEADNSLTHHQIELHDHHMRTTLTIFFDDASKAELFSGQFRFIKTSEGFELNDSNSFAEAVREHGGANRTSQTFILPGNVLNKPAGSTTDGRKVSWLYDEKKWTDSDTDIAQQKPRKIRCGPSLIGDRELAAFARERDDLREGCEDLEIAANKDTGSEERRTGPGDAVTGPRITSPARRR